MRMAFLGMIQKLEAKNKNSHQLVFLLGKKNHYQVKRVKTNEGKNNTLAIHIVDRGLHSANLHSANRGEKRKQKLGKLYDLTFHRK